MRPLLPLTFFQISDPVLQTLLLVLQLLQYFQILCLFCYQFFKFFAQLCSSFFDLI